VGRRVRDARIGLRRQSLIERVRFHLFSFFFFRLEAAKDDYRIHCEELEKQLIEVQHRNDELTGLAEESRALKDELDVLRCVCVCVCVVILSIENCSMFSSCSLFPGSSSLTDTTPLVASRRPAHDFTDYQCSYVS